MTRRLVRVEIDELVVEGRSRAEAQAMGRALELELTRLLSAPGALEALSARPAVDRLDAGTVWVAPAVAPAQLGAVVGRSVQRALVGDSPGPAAGVPRERGHT